MKGHRIMQIANATVFITGANRGIGLAFARAALQRGARKVYAGARDPDSVTLAGVVPVRVDVNNPDSVIAAARNAGDVNIVINNAGIAQFGGFLQAGGLESARAQMETNFFGPLRIAQGFAPVLAAHGGGALLNVLSVASWISRPQLAIYAASKTAAWSLHMGFVDTDLTTGIDAPKSSADDIVRVALDALEAGAEEVLADEITRQVKRGLSAEPGVYLAAP
jgi:NAD(P)-dependent dehydrogenase (short-subunit alcohol dehydrogenase family)